MTSDQIFGPDGPCIEEVIYGGLGSLSSKIRFRLNPKFVITDPYEIASKYGVELPVSYDAVDDAKHNYLTLKDLLLRKGLSLRNE